MSLQSLNPELTAKVLLLANLQRHLMQNQNLLHDRTAEVNSLSSTGAKPQEQTVHPLLIPSLNVSAQKISAMLSALTPSVTSPPSISSSLSGGNEHTRLLTASATPRSSGSSFGWGNRERKMEENWRMQHRHTGI